jgi:hypothetical protein
MPLLVPSTAITPFALARRRNLENGTILTESMKVKYFNLVLPLLTNGVKTDLNCFEVRGASSLWRNQGKCAFSPNTRFGRPPSTERSPSPRRSKRVRAPTPIVVDMKKKNQRTTKRDQSASTLSPAVSVAPQAKMPPFDGSSHIKLQEALIKAVSEANYNRGKLEGQAEEHMKTKDLWAARLADSQSSSAARIADSQSSSAARLADWERSLGELSSAHSLNQQHAMEQSTKWMDFALLLGGHPTLPTSAHEGSDSSSLAQLSEFLQSIQLGDFFGPLKNRKVSDISSLSFLMEEDRKAINMLPWQFRKMQHFAAAAASPTAKGTSN